MHGARRGHLSFVMPTGKLMAVGGIGENRARAEAQELIEEYDVATDTWTVLGPTPFASTRAPAGVQLADGTPFVVAGAETWTYDVSAARWTRHADAPTDSVSSPTELPDGRVLVTSGDARIHVWSRATDHWSTIAMPHPWNRSMTARALGDGRVFVLGDVEASIWHSKDETWSTIEIPSSLRQWSSPTRLANDDLLMVGEADGSNPALSKLAQFAFVPTPVVLFRPATTEWRTLWLPRLGLSPTARVLPSGKVLLVDGRARAPSSSYPFANDVAVVDPATCTASLYERVGALSPNVDVVAGKVVVSGGSHACGHGCIDIGLADVWVLDAPP